MATVGAQSHLIFGLRTGVRNNLCFIDDQTVVFPSGNNCVCYNTVEKSQRIIPGSEKIQGMRALAISANRRYLAMSECGETATITVFDLHHEQGRKRKVLTAGDTPAQEFVCMAFSQDSKFLIGQTGAPEWMLIFWLWEKHKVLATIKTSNSNYPVNQVSFNTFNNKQLCVSGTGVFKVFRYTEGVLKQISLSNIESINLLCHAWLTADSVIAGTDTGRLLVFESGDLRREISMVKIKRIKATDGNESRLGHRITAVLSYSKGFACSLGSGKVCLFEKKEDDSYTRSRVIQIPGPAVVEYQEIDTMCISPAEDTLAISTDRRQLYSFSLSSVDMNKVEDAHFEFLLQPFHSESITGLSICVRKPIVATCSLDYTVRIWNYETKAMDLCKEFQEEVYCVALHPSGLFILIGFSYKIKLMNLLIDDIRTFRDFSVQSCTECAFSHGGHMFAAVSGSLIYIYSFISFEKIFTLKSHIQKVCGIEWGQDDNQLVSCGMDGAVFVWNTQTGKPVSDCIFKTCSYTGIGFSSDGKTILVVGTNGTLKEIQDFQVTNITVSRSSRVIFTGTSSGTIIAIKYPLPLQKEWIIYQAHCGPITKMVITFDEQFLLTVSEDGCLMMWKIVDKEGRGLKSTRQIIHTEEILVTKSDLEKKNQILLKLKMRLEELHIENEYHLRLKDMNHNMMMKELSDKFTQEIESLTTTQQKWLRLSTMQGQCVYDNAPNQSLCHQSFTELSYSKKLIVEHNMYQDLQRKHLKMHEEYEMQLKAAEAASIQAQEELKQLYEAKLQAQTQLLSEVSQGEQSREFDETLKQLEEDEKSKISNIQLNYERKLRTERETNTNLKGEAGVLTQKVYSLQRMIDDSCTDVNKLKEERQRLLGLTHTLKGDNEDLRRQIKGHERDNAISNLKKKNQDLEKLKFVLDCQLNDLKQLVEPQKEEIIRKKERIHQEALRQSDKSNSQMKLTVSDLRLQMRAREMELQKEMQKVRDLETHLQRLKSDLHNCVGFIQEPKKLKENVQTIYKHYVSQPDRVSDACFVNAEASFRLLIPTGVILTSTILTVGICICCKKCRVYANFENVTLISEINELRKELHSLRSQVKEQQAQMATLEMNKSHLAQEFDQEDVN
uniref:EML-like second beta-propeller domain-containing protein n=1 Tax=Mola mola TaxID=94237 RepID=A0A3Q4B5Q5_MOLML